MALFISSCANHTPNPQELIDEASRRYPEKIEKVSTLELEHARKIFGMFKQDEYLRKDGVYAAPLNDSMFRIWHETTGESKQDLKKEVCDYTFTKDGRTVIVWSSVVNNGENPLQALAAGGHDQTFFTEGGVNIDNATGAVINFQEGSSAYEIKYNTDTTESRFGKHVPVEIFESVMYDKGTAQKIVDSQLKDFEFIEANLSEKK